jgi:acetyl-CoA carboxylase carboxyl transferase subunit beta
MSAPESRPASDETESIWIKCTACQEILFRKEVERRLFVCSKCGAHLRLTVEQRLLTLVDRGSFTEHDADLRSTDPLQFSDRRPYGQRLTDAWRKTGRYDAALCGVGSIAGRSVALGIFDFSFLGGSMGTVVGEKLTRIVEHAIRERLPVVFFAASGGARMQEGVLSLMQMAKVNMVLGCLREEGLPYLSVMTDPTTGGVAASLGLVGDLNIAEPQALIGFAGPRVIEQTIREKLPPGFQRSEFLLEHGMMDIVVERKDLRRVIGQVLALLCDEQLQERRTKS